MSVPDQSFPAHAPRIPINCMDLILWTESVSQSLFELELEQHEIQYRGHKMKQVEFHDRMDQRQWRRDFVLNWVGFLWRYMQLRGERLRWK